MGVMDVLARMAARQGARGLGAASRGLDSAAASYLPEGIGATGGALAGGAAGVMNADEMGMDPLQAMTAGAVSGGVAGAGLGMGARGAMNVLSGLAERGAGALSRAGVDVDTMLRQAGLNPERMAPSVRQSLDRMASEYGAEPVQAYINKIAGGQGYRRNGLPDFPRPNDF